MEIKLHCSTPSECKQEHIFYIFIGTLLYVGWFTHLGINSTLLFVHVCTAVIMKNNPPFKVYFILHPRTSKILEQILKPLIYSSAFNRTSYTFGLARNYCNILTRTSKSHQFASVQQAGLFCMSQLSIL